MRLVVPFAPGGSSEIIARSFAREFSKNLGHVGTLAMNPAMFAKLPYDANRDFAPVSLLAVVPDILVVNASLPVKERVPIPTPSLM